MPVIERVTLFKVADKANRQKILQAYDVLKAKQSKVFPTFLLQGNTIVY